MRLYEYDCERSLVSMSDDTSHGAATIIASIKPILEELVLNNCKNIIVISDSPLRQSRNKTIFWFVKYFSERYFVTFKWIYLESGHGKGLPDGIRATVKKVIHSLVACNPNAPIYIMMMNYWT